MNSGEQLCVACGLCCDGTLFDNVQLGASDDAETLKALGLPVKLSRARVPVAFVRQPCPALCEDRTCRVYTERPGQCRSFECAVFKDAQSGKISQDKALRWVKQAQGKADKVRRLLRKLGDTDEKSSLGIRFRRVQRKVESGTVDAAAAEVFSDLGLAVHQLDLLAHRRFYTQEEEA